MSESASGLRTTEPPDIAVSVIRPERTTAASEAEEPATTAEEDPQTGSGKHNGSHAAWYIVGLTLTAAAAVAVILMKNRF